MSDPLTVFPRDTIRDPRTDPIRKTGTTQGVFFWSRGYVVRALSDDWYVVRIHGRSAGTEEFTLPDERELPKPEPLEWEFQKDRLHMMGTPLFFFHEER